MGDSADRDSITSNETSSSGGRAGNDQVEVTRSEHDSHTFQDESSDDDISYNNDQSQDDYLNSFIHLKSQDGDLSESDDDYSRTQNRIGDSISFDDILLSEGSSETLLPNTYSSDFEDSDYPNEHAVAFPNQLDDESECSSIESESYNPTTPLIPEEEHQRDSDIRVRYDVGTISGEYIYASESSESSESLEVQEILDSCLRKTDQNECVGLTRDSFRKNSFVQSIDSPANQFLGSSGLEYIYQAESDDESEVQQILDASLEEESLIKQNICADFRQRNREDEAATEVQVTSLHELNTTIQQRKPIGSSSSRQGNSDELIKPEETRLLSNKEWATCDKIDKHSACEDDIKTGDHKLNRRSQELDIDFAVTRTLSAKEKIRMRVSIPPRFVRTFPVRRLIASKSKRAHELIRHVKRISSEARRNKRARQKKRANRKKSRIIIIPSNHPYKILWDLFTVLLTFISAYTTHTSIRDRKYEFTTFAIFTEAWFILDILLNFITARQNSDGTIMCNGSAVWARYLTTWFPIDVLALVPWEGMFLTPIIEKQNRRNIFTKWFFRSKATVKVTRILKGHHYKMFGRVVNRTKKIGVGGRRLLTIIIKYLPKYILFYRNMKPILVLKVLRQIHFGRKVVRSMTKPSHENDEDEGKISDNDDDLQPDEHPDDSMENISFENDDASCSASCMSNISSHMNLVRCSSERCSSDINAKRSFSEGL